MKAFLMFEDQDFSLEKPLPGNEQDLIKDLELSTLFTTMARGDEFLLKVIRQALLDSLCKQDAISYRQEILEDCLNHPAIIRELYQITIEVVENKKKRWLGFFTHSASGLLYSAVEMMQMFMLLLRRLKTLAEEHGTLFESPGFKRFFSMIKKELDDDYFAVLENHLNILKFNEGVSISLSLGKGNEGTDIVLRYVKSETLGFLKRIINKRKPEYSFSIAERDEAGARALSDLKDRGLNMVANAVAQSAEHINSFFTMLRVELAFYVGCLNLSEELENIGCPISFPDPQKKEALAHAFTDLYDISLALILKKRIAGNDVNANQKKLVIITGANQGGKSTFLRSIGLAQLMMQCGMFVPARKFSANLCTGIFTHYKRREDADMVSGKLDEELSRMSGIVELITPHAMILFNESFASTNEREGSEIARQITQALSDNQVKIFHITHLFEFANTYFEMQRKDVLFLRAKRKAAGKQDYRLIKGKPLKTSFGVDVFKEIFE
jgi:hypothetical protein